MDFGLFYDKYYFVLQNFVRVIEIFFNTVEIFIVIFYIIKATRIQMVAGGKAKDTICKGVSYALNYNLATEVMKIIILREANELFMIFGILILKIMIVCLFMLEEKYDKIKEKNRKNKPVYIKESLVEKIKSFFNKKNEKK